MQFDQIRITEDSGKVDEFIIKAGKRAIKQWENLRKEHNVNFTTAERVAFLEMNFAEVKKEIRKLKRDNFILLAIMLATLIVALVV